MGEDSIVATIILTAINRASGEIAAVGGELEGLGSKGQAAGGLLSSGWTKAALGVGALTAGVVAFSVNAASKFEDTILKVANNTHMTTQEMSAMRQQVLKMGAESPAPLSEIALGFERAADAGFRGKQGFDVVQAAMKAAVETGGKVPDVVDAVTLSLHNFDLPAKDSGRALGMMMTAAADAVMRLPDLANNMNKVSQVAGQMHMPLADLLGAYATLTLSTHDASKTQTELAGAFTHILQPTKATTTEIQALSKASGVDLHAAFQKVSSGNMSFIDFLKTVNGSLDKAHLSAGDTKAAIFSLFGGQRGGLAGLSLINDLKTLQKTTDDVRNHTSLVGDEWKRTLDSMGNQSKILGNNVQILGITVGDFLIPKITEAEKWVNTLASETESGKGPIADFGKAAYNAGTFISDNFVGPLISGVQKSKDFQQAVHELGGEFGGLGGALHDLIAPLGLFSSNSKDAHDKAQLLATVLRDAATVIKDIFVAAVQASMLVIGIFKDSVKLAAGVVGDAIHAIVQAVQDMGTIFQSEFQLISDLVHGNFGKIWSDIQNVGHNIETFWADLWHNAYTLISNFAKNVANLVEDFVKHIVQFFEGLYHDLVGGSIIPDMITAIIAWFGKLPRAVFGIIAGLVASTVGQFASMSSQVLGKMAGFVSSLIADAGKAAAGFISGLNPIIPGAEAVIASMISGIAGQIGGLIGNMASWGAQAASSFIGGIGGALGGVGNMLGGFADHFKPGSPPPLEPSFDMHAWGFTHGQNFVVGVAGGILSGANLVSDAVAAVNRAAQAGLAGDSTKQVQALSTKLSNSTQSALDHFALDLIRHTGNLNDDAAAIVASTAAQRKLTDAQAKGVEIQNAANLAMDRAQGKFTSTISAITTKLADGVQNATDHFVYDVLNHTGHLKQDAAAIARSTAAQDRYTAALNWALGPKARIETATARRDDNVTKADDTYAYDLIHHSGNLKADSAAIVDATNKQHWLNDHLAKATAIQDAANRAYDRASGHYTSTIDHVSQQLSGNLTNALDKYAYDLLHHTGNLKADAAAIAAASKAQDDYTNVINKAAAQASPSAQWNYKVQQAGDKASTTMDALSLAIADGSKHTGTLAKNAADAAEKAQKLADAQDKAAQQVDKLTGNWSDLFGRQQSTAQKALEQAKAKYELDLLHGKATQADIDAITSSQQALNSYTDAVNKADAVAAQAQTTSTAATYAQVASAQNAIVAQQLQVIAANTSVSTAQNAIAIGAINAATTAINNQTAIVQAQTGVMQAASNGQISAIQAQSAIMTALVSVQTAALSGQAKMIADQASIATAQTNAVVAGINAATKAEQDAKAIDAAQLALSQAAGPQAIATAASQLQVARETQALDQQEAALQAAQAQAQLKSAQDQLTADVADAAAARAVAVAQLKEAQDKARADASAASFAAQLAVAQLNVAQVKSQLDIADQALQQKVMQDQLVVATDQLQLQQDQLQLAVDQLTALGDINDALKAATSTEQMQAADQAKINADNKAIADAQAMLGADQSAQAQYAAQAQQTIATLSLGVAQLQQEAQTEANALAAQLASDAAAVASAQGNQQITSSGYQVTLAADKAAENLIQNQLAIIAAELQKISGSVSTTATNTATANNELGAINANLGDIKELNDQGFAGLDVSSDHGMNAAMRAVQTLKASI